MTKYSSREMKSRRFSVMLRLAAAMAGHFFPFPRLKGLSQWRSLTDEAWEFFWISLLAGLTLVFSVSAIIRGKPEEKGTGVAPRRIVNDSGRDGLLPS